MLLYLFHIICHIGDPSIEVSLYIFVDFTRALSPNLTCTTSQSQMTMTQLLALPCACAVGGGGTHNLTNTNIIIPALIRRSTPDRRAPRACGLCLTSSFHFVVLQAVQRSCTSSLRSVPVPAPTLSHASSQSALPSLPWARLSHLASPCTIASLICDVTQPSPASVLLRPNGVPPTPPPPPPPSLDRAARISSSTV